MTTHDAGSPAWLVEELTRHRVLDPQSLELLVRRFLHENPYGDASAFARLLVDEKLLTDYQADRAVQGDADKLVLGPYLLAERIGAGSLGTVYRAIGRADKRSYAVKILPKRAAWNIRSTRRQVRAFNDIEIQSAIVPFLDIGTAAGYHYLVWPFVEGETLERLVEQRGPLSPVITARLAYQLARLLHMTGSRGIFHGLVKPANVLIGVDGQATLLDFGIGALLVDNLDADESVIDTISQANATSNMLDFAAPEVTLDPAKRGIAADQYSLGCTLYYALTGRPPFPSGNAVDKMLAHQTKQPEPLSRQVAVIPAHLVVTIERLMAKAPEARFPSFESVVESLAIFPDIAGPLLLSGKGTARREESSGVDTKPVEQTRTDAVNPTAGPNLAAPSGVLPALEYLGEPLPVPSGLGVVFRRLFLGSAIDSLVCDIYAPSRALRGFPCLLRAVVYLPNAVPDLKGLPQQKNVHRIGGGSFLRPLPRSIELECFLGLIGVPPTEALPKLHWDGRAIVLTWTIDLRDLKYTLPGEVSFGWNRVLVAKFPFEIPLY